MKIKKVAFEMAMERQDAIECCYNLGKLFISHFHKIYKESKSAESFSHHCQEMQEWLNKCRNITLKLTNRRITSIELTDWFFTATGNVDAANGFSTSDEITAYNKFVSILNADWNRSVISAAEEVLRR